MNSHELAAALEGHTLEEIARALHQAAEQICTDETALILHYRQGETHRGVGFVGGQASLADKILLVQGVIRRVFQDQPAEALPLIREKIGDEIGFLANITQHNTPN